MNLYPLIACAALTCLPDPAAQAQSTNAGVAIPASAAAARPAIRLQQSSQKSTPSARAGLTASTPAVTNPQHAGRNELSSREKLARFRAHHVVSGAPSDEVWNNDTAYASPYAPPSSVTSGQAPP